MNDESKNSKKRMKYKSGGRYNSAKNLESIPLGKLEGISFALEKSENFHGILLGSRRGIFMKILSLIILLLYCAIVYYTFKYIIIYISVFAYIPMS